MKKILIGSRTYEMPDTVPATGALIAAQGSQFEKDLEAEMEIAEIEQRDGAPSIVTPKSKTRAEALTALKALKYFMGPLQTACVIDNFRDEERQYFYDLMCELAARIATMPQTYDQDGKGDDAIVTLHYFAGGRASWWITEKDKGCADDGKIVDGELQPENSQQQAFGLADLFGDGGELGYISIAEILANNGELDFHFTPKTLREVRAENNK
jgi:hypothetical protein